jgi:broad specificity phosphatase PhoE
MKIIIARHGAYYGRNRPILNEYGIEQMTKLSEKLNGIISRKDSIIIVSGKNGIEKKSADFIINTLAESDKKISKIIYKDFGDTTKESEVSKMAQVIKKLIEHQSHKRIPQTFIVVTDHFFTYEFPDYYIRSINQSPLPKKAFSCGEAIVIDSNNPSNKPFYINANSFI